MDMYFRQFWQDPRLSFEKRPNLDKLVVGAEYINQIWVPDTFFVNEKTAYFHKATTENQFLRILHTGETLRSIRYGKSKEAKLGQLNEMLVLCLVEILQQEGGPATTLGAIVRVCCLLFYPRDISPLECDVMFLCLLLPPACRPDGGDLTSPPTYCSGACQSEGFFRAQGGGPPFVQ